MDLQTSELMKITIYYAAGRLLRLVALNEVSKPMDHRAPAVHRSTPPIWCWANPTPARPFCWCPVVAQLCSLRVSIGPISQP
jgi:hypothetical protein